MSEKSVLMEAIDASLQVDCAHSIFESNIFLPFKRGLTIGILNLLTNDGVLRELRRKFIVLLEESMKLLITASLESSASQICRLFKKELTIWLESIEFEN
jgi:hypothetical protein